MNPEQIALLLEAMQPDTEEQRDIFTRLMKRVPDGHSGGDVGRGWYPILDRLDKALAETDPDYKLHQVKEKFGGLRFYTSPLSEEGRELVAGAENECLETCEDCGQPGKICPIRPGSHWIIVNCDECQAKKTN